MQMMDIDRLSKEGTFWREPSRGRSFQQQHNSLLWIGQCLGKTAHCAFAQLVIGQRALCSELSGLDGQKGIRSWFCSRRRSQLRRSATGCSVDPTQCSSKLSSVRR